ncbi:MAG: penicillin-binding protein 2 [Patescibacteria group bacterium]|jgi:penicillin-binding protein 2
MKKNIFEIDTTFDEEGEQKKYRIDAPDDDLISPFSSNEEHISLNFDLSKLRWFFIIIIIFFSVLFFRTGYLQIIRGDEYKLAAEENRIRVEEIKAPRGNILDRNGNVLAYNIPNFVLQLIPADFTNNEAEKNNIIDKISSILKIDFQKLKETISAADATSYQPVVLADHIPYDQAILLKISSSNWPGIGLKTDSFRKYSNDFSFSHVLGYVGKLTTEEYKTLDNYTLDDYVGKSGLESYYESELKGEKGKKEIEVDSFGKEKKVVAETQPTQGRNLTLTLDEKLQSALYNALENELKVNKSATGGSAVAIDPKTGEVLALVSYPSFNDNNFTLGVSSDEYNNIISNPERPLFDRSISAEYPSGSTIKPLIASAALQEGIVNEYTTFLSSGGIQIDKWFFPDWKAGGHGVTDIKKALAESVNTYFYMIGGGDNNNFTGLGVEKIKKYLSLFGLNSPLGIDLPGEASGFLPDKDWKEKTKGEPWYIGDTYHLAIGQGDLLVTPLQVASYTATIANGGTFYRPYLIKSFLNQKNNTSSDLVPEIIRNNFISSQNIRIVQEGLRQGVTTGSSSILNNFPVAVAGKTGTAQFGNEGKSHGWFTCYAPYDNPEIAITVVIEGGGEGHLSALPVAREGLKAWFNIAE